tara:strand:+ start:1 stop:867 length:867 start_codon:yes stop_codon:yes gene_type:complete
MSIEGVKERVEETESIIKKLFAEDIELVSYMRAPNDLSVEGFRKLVFCSLATQVAIYDNYVALNGKPDCVMGLSLGDVPRSVVSGLVSFEEGVRNLYLFTSMHALAGKGLCVHIKLEDTFEASTDLLQLDKYEIHKSVIQNEKFGLLAGKESKMKRWISEVAIPNNLTFRLMYPFPLHTELMAPVAEKMRPFVIKACDIECMHTHMFSTVYGKLLTDNKDIIKDCSLNIAASLDFPKAIDNVIEHYGDVRFVNIGPSNSLIKFLNSMDLPSDTLITDWYEKTLMLLAA